MRNTPILLLCALLCINSPPPCHAQSRAGKPADASALAIRPDQVRVYFSPKGGCTQAVVEEIRNAKQFILVQAYSFTSAPIAGALVEAFRSGVRVEAVLDKSNKTANYSEATFLKKYEAGEAFGELALLYNAPRAATIVADTDSLLWSLDRGTFFPNNSIIGAGGKQ
jgi:phosphatidylserine/phosphatidylglycerophosphate/cardiolipin synthase-like enzyme